MSEQSIKDYERMFRNPKAIEADTKKRQELLAKHTQSELLAEDCCGFCAAPLGVPEYISYGATGAQEFKECLRCGYQWAKKYYENARTRERR